ncbi:glycoside hydrolase family 5 protein, partial [Moniliophthora roreri]
SWNEGLGMSRADSRSGTLEAVQSLTSTWVAASNRSSRFSLVHCQINSPQPAQDLELDIESIPLGARIGYGAFTDTSVQHREIQGIREEDLDYHVSPGPIVPRRPNMQSSLVTLLAWPLDIHN